MCRSIKPLRTGRETVGQEDIRAAALQYVRKVSGVRTPTARTSPAFDQAVAEIAEATERLLAGVIAGMQRRA